MKKAHFIFGQILILILILINLKGNTIVANTSSTDVSSETDYEIDNKNKNDTNNYTFPDFYRGIYLNVYSARNFNKLKKFVTRAKASGVNAMVLDVQRLKNDTCAIPSKNIDYCIKNGIHPIARIVVFQSGLKIYPVPKHVINNRLNIAENACKNGFREIQFDYIRFSDYKISKKLSYKEKYDFIEGFLSKAKKRLQKYNAKIAADVFGRIPLNNNDAIGQKMEVLDKVVDIICPMAYPSHYTWSKKMIADPYFTVHLTSKRAKERTKNAEIVTYIQAFKIKIKESNLTFEKYIEEQIKAVHDAEIRGYIHWNARQVYDVPFNVMEKLYKDTKEAYLPYKKDKSS